MKCSGSEKMFSYLKQILFVMVLLLGFGCSCGVAMATPDVVIIVSDDATVPQKHAAGELARDMEKVYGFAPDVIPEADTRVEAETITAYSVIFVGSAGSGMVEGLDVYTGVPVTADDPGPEAFVLQSFEWNGRPALLIAGSDDRGTLYGVYEFSEKYLGVDPYEFWTGRAPEKRDTFELPDVSFKEQSPVFPLRGYFDNDNDMIANWRDPKLIIEFDVWKEMIDSLARLRYNYVDLHDTLGRAEFWNWEYYTSRFDYHTDVELIDQIIDYVHEKGMLVQIPMYLGWEFHHLPEDKFCLSEYYDDWMEVYRYYLEDSPIGKADLFLQRPRDPWWDRAYKCLPEAKEGIDPGPLMTKMFNGLLELVDEHAPGGTVICDLWSEGRDMWRRNSFNPDTRVDMMWADGGYANYSEWPEDFKDHKFGVYIHAGYYLNHVTQNPYPAKIKDATLEAVRRNMTANYFVNGQDFKHFILNLEAAGRIAWNPEAFDPEAFYFEWTTRYFGAEAAPLVVESLKLQHQANETASGFTKIMGRTKDIVNMLKLFGAERVDMAPIDEGLKFSEESLLKAQEAEALVPESAKLVYDDQVVFPALIYHENLKLYKAAAETMNAFADRTDTSLSKEELKDASKRLETWKKRTVGQLISLREILEEGSKWKKWDGWTKPENFRKITPPPDPEEVKRIFRSLK